MAVVLLNSTPVITCDHPTTHTALCPFENSTKMLRSSVLGYGCQPQCYSKQRRRPNQNKFQTGSFDFGEFSGGSRGGANPAMPSPHRSCQWSLASPLGHKE